MTTLTPIDPQTPAARPRAGQATLIDIREPGEFALDHIVAARLAPRVDDETFAPNGGIESRKKAGLAVECNRT